MIRPSQSTTRWSSSNQSCPIWVVVAITRSQPSAGSPLRDAVSCTVGAQPRRPTANATGTEMSPHNSANRMSGAASVGLTQYWITGGCGREEQDRLSPSVDGASGTVDISGPTQQPCPYV